MCIIVCVCICVFFNVCVYIFMTIKVNVHKCLVNYISLKYLLCPTSCLPCLLSLNATRKRRTFRSMTGKRRHFRAPLGAAWGLKTTPVDKSQATLCVRHSSPTLVGETTVNYGGRDPEATRSRRNSDRTRDKTGELICGETVLKSAPGHVIYSQGPRKGSSGRATCLDNSVGLQCSW